MTATSTARLCLIPVLAAAAVVDIGVADIVVAVGIVGDDGVMMGLGAACQVVAAVELLAQNTRNSGAKKGVEAARLLYAQQVATDMPSPVRVRFVGTTSRERMPDQHRSHCDRWDSHSRPRPP